MPNLNERFLWAQTAIAQLIGPAAPGSLLVGQMIQGKPYWIVLPPGKPGKILAVGEDGNLEWKDK